MEKDRKEWNKYRKLQLERPEEFEQSEALRIELDEAIVEQYVDQYQVKLGVVYENEYSMLIVDLVRDEKGKLFPYQRLLSVQKSGMVVTIPRYNDKLVLLRQYRHALRAEQYAFPRGFGTAGISSKENAAKELREEIGAAVSRSVYMGSVVADSGLSGSRVDVYLCDVEQVELKYLYEGIKEVILLSEQELLEWIANGKIDDGFTLAAMMLYQNKA